MKFGLKENVIERINSVFAQFPVVHEVILYGSRAKRNYNPGSDIDLTLKGGLLNYDTLSSISLQIDDLLLPYTFDLSIFAHPKNADLLEHICRAGKVFYSTAESNISVTD